MEPLRFSAVNNRLKPAFPDFENPPVIEVVLGVQFSPLLKLGTPQTGLVWEHFRTRFPKTQDQTPLDPLFEDFDVRPPRYPAFRVELVNNLPAPRCWFLNEAGTELIQLQRDRFLHNWRKVTGADEYPRYEKIKGSFEKELQSVAGLLENSEIGVIEPNQWEVTYVNHIPIGELLETFGGLEKLLTVWEPNYSDSFLSQAEQAQVLVRYVIKNNLGNPIGRLHVTAQPAYRTGDDKPIVVLTLTARGRPKESTLESALQGLDIGHEWVVRGFTSITTPQAHIAWRRKDDQ